MQNPHTQAVPGRRFRQRDRKPTAQQPETTGLSVMPETPPAVQVPLVGARRVQVRFSYRLAPHTEDLLPAGIPYVERGTDAEVDERQRERARALGTYDEGDEEKYRNKRHDNGELVLQSRVGAKLSLDFNALMPQASFHPVGASCMKRQDTARVKVRDEKTGKKISKQMPVTKIIVVATYLEAIDENREQIRSPRWWDMGEMKHLFERCWAEVHVYVNKDGAVTINFAGCNERPHEADVPEVFFELEKTEIGMTEPPKREKDSSTN